MSNTKKRLLGLLNLLLIGAVGAAAWWWFEDYIAQPWTRDGQVRGHVIQIAPRVSGMVTRIAVVDNQFVEQGQLLFELDSEPPASNTNDYGTSMNVMPAPCHKKTSTGVKLATWSH